MRLEIYMPGVELEHIKKLAKGRFVCNACNHRFDKAVHYVFLHNHKQSYCICHTCYDRVISEFLDTGITHLTEDEYEVSKVMEE